MTSESCSIKDTLIRLIRDDPFGRPLEVVLSPEWASEYLRPWVSLIPDEISDIWTQLPEEARLVAYIIAISNAMRP